MPQPDACAVSLIEMALSSLGRRAWLHARPLCQWVAQQPPHLWPAQWLPACPHLAAHRSFTNRQINRKTGVSKLPAEVLLSTGQDGEECYQLKVKREDLPVGKAKLRLDAYLAGQLAQGQAASRAKVHAAIKAGQVTVNGRKADKPSQAVTPGSVITCTLLPAPSLEAMPEPIPLDVFYEDDHLMVINKPAGMAVHISPGHHSGTLVNALLSHCGLPGVRIDPAYPSNLPQVPNINSAPDLSTTLDLSALQAAAAHQGMQPTGPGTSSALSTWHTDDDDGGDGELDGDGDDDHDDDTAAQQPSVTLSEQQQQVVVVQRQAMASANSGAAPHGVIRPGIVHRLDLGTSGLLVVAKREPALRALSAQFKARTVGRVYESITIGCPASAQGKVLTNIDRDPADRKRMAALAYGSGRGRTAASNYWVLEGLAGGGAGLVQWKLDTGRTHQIRVHAKHMGHSLVGDVVYGGAATSAVNTIKRTGIKLPDAARDVIMGFSRPALHAKSLAFDHPATGERLSFTCDMPQDMQQLLNVLRDLN